MRAVIQRVAHASVTIEGAVKSEIGQGFLILLGVCDEDSMEDVDWLVKKVANLRVFDDEQGVMNLSIQDIGSSRSLRVIRKVTAPAGSRQVRTSTLSHSTRPSAVNSQQPSARP